MPDEYTKSPLTAFFRARGRTLRWVAQTAGIPEHRLSLYALGRVHGLRGGEIERVALALGVGVEEMPRPEWRNGKVRRGRRGVE